MMIVRGGDGGVLEEKVIY